MSATRRPQGRAEDGPRATETYYVRQHESGRLTFNLQWKPVTDIDTVAIVQENFPGFFNGLTERQVTMEDTLPWRENEDEQQVHFVELEQDSRSNPGKRRIAPFTGFVLEQLPDADQHPGFRQYESLAPFQKMENAGAAGENSMKMAEARSASMRIDPDARVVSNNALLFSPNQRSLLTQQEARARMVDLSNRSASGAGRSNGPYSESRGSRISER